MHIRHASPAPRDPAPGPADDHPITPALRLRTCQIISARFRLENERHARMAIEIPMITAERLRELLAYDQESGMFTWKVRRARIAPGSMAGYVSIRGYVRIVIEGRTYDAHRLAWLYIHGNWPADQIDHINREKADNRLANLRQATRSENGANSPSPRNNTSGYKGVGKAESGRWVARIGHLGKQIYLGIFDTPEAASSAYRAAAQRYFGKFAA